MSEKIMYTTKNLDGQGRLTIPKTIRNLFDLGPDDKVKIILKTDGFYVCPEKKKMG